MIPPAAPEPIHAPPPNPAEEILDPISTALRGILVAAEGKAMSLAQIATHLKERGWALMVLFLAAPFPIPNIPGLSTPFGIAIGLIGWGFMLRRQPWLPSFIMRTTLQYSTLERVVPFIARLMEKLERWTKPRMKWLTRGPVCMSVIGLSIVSGGLFLGLPLPFPLTNGPPAVSIILLVVGMLCRDGLMVLFGHLLGVLSWVYLAAWIYFGAYLWPIFMSWWEAIKNWF